MIDEKQHYVKGETGAARYKLFLTPADRRRLQRLGYSEEQINDLKPTEGMEYLAPADSWERLLAHLGRGGSLFLWPYKDLTGKWHEDPATARPVGHMQLQTPDTDSYFTPNPTTGRKRGNEYVAALNCLFADFDARDFDDGKAAITTHLETLQRYPSVIIDSGGGYHCYWLFEEPWMIDAPSYRTMARDAQARWVSFVGGDSGSKDIAHVLRVPGTLNHKYDPPLHVTIQYANFNQLYSFPELYVMLMEAVAKSESQLPETPTEKGEGREVLDLWEKAMSADVMDYTMSVWADDTVIRYLDRTPGFSRLWGGDLSNYRKENGDVDHSAADQAFVNHLNYGTRGDEAQSWRIFTRWIEYGTEKHKRPDYWQRTWAKASERHVYRPYMQPGQHQRGNGSDLDAELAKLHRTDMGNAERLARRFGEQLRYVTEWGWLSFDGGKWEQADAGANQAAHKTVRAIYRETATLTDADRRQDLAKWAAASENNARINALLLRAQYMPAIYAQTEDFDGADMLLNLPNGTLDLQTNELRPHDPADMLTKTAGAIYDPDATCPRWETFLDEIMAGNDDIIRFVQRAVGYSLTGSTEEQCLFFLYGTGANGKTTFAEVLMALLGDYSVKTRTETLLARQYDNGPNNDVAALTGARLVVAAEIPEGRRLNENLVKDLTGGDQITARFLRKEFFSFTPVFKLWMYGNHKPTIRGTDEGMWRRLRLIPFEVEILDENQDKHLKHKLFAELPGILNWALEGLRGWQEHGLKPPQEVESATSGYRAEMDTLQVFIDDCCFVNSAVSAKFSDLYDAYERWGGDSISRRAFGQQLTERGYSSDRGTGNVAIRRGIALLTDPDDSAALITAPPVNN